MAAEITGLSELIGSLQAFGKKVYRKVLKDAVNAGTKVALVGAKSAVQVDTGLLKRSLARKTKAFKKGTIVVGIVGPRTAMKTKKVKGPGGEKTKIRVETGFAKKVSRGGRKEVYAIPSKYSHLVEKGTVRSRAFPFLGPAGSSPAVQRAVEDKLAQGIEEAAGG